MEKMKHLGTAIRWAAEVHDGQFDKSGVPYILHALAVMEMAGQRVGLDDKDRETIMIIAVLHDTFEDHRGPKLAKMRFKERVRDIFGTRVHDALVLLSHLEDRREPYDEYIERVATDWMTTIVKICDLTHNMDPRRIPAYQIVDKDFERWHRYRKALIRLERE